ncbi:MAG: cyanophycinase [Cyanobacteria bacterium P01_D01_bin.1]
MLEVKPLLAHKPMTVSTQYPVMIIGGAEDKTNGCSILNAFVKSAGGDSATIGIIPSASREPAVVGNRYYQLFTAMGAPHVQVLDIRHRSECEEERWIEVLNDCSGVFITGGDQLRLRDLIGDTRLLQVLKEKLARAELVLAGTSAGAAIMGEQMIAGGSSGESPNQSLVDLTSGLGFVPELLVDQHFHNRNRMARLLSAIAAHPNRLGVGIDEDTCIAIAEDGISHVLGKGTITIIDPGNLTHTSYPESRETSPLSLHNLKVHILNQGDRYDYKARALIQLQS